MAAHTPLLVQRQNRTFFDKLLTPAPWDEVVMASLAHKTEAILKRAAGSMAVLPMAPADSHRTVLADGGALHIEYERLPHAGVDVDVNAVQSTSSRLTDPFQRLSRSLAALFGTSTVTVEATSAASAEQGDFIVVSTGGGNGRGSAP